MPVRVAINGFGRIGRNFLRVCMDDPDIQIVAVNDLTDSKTLAHLLTYDSIHGKFKGQVEAHPDRLVVNNQSIDILAQKDPKELPWKQHQIDIVIEATGKYRAKKWLEKHLMAGVDMVKTTFRQDGKLLMVPSK